MPVIDFAARRRRARGPGRESGPSGAPAAPPPASDVLAAARADRIADRVHAVEAAAAAVTSIECAQGLLAALVDGLAAVPPGEVSPAAREAIAGELRAVRVVLGDAQAAAARVGCFPAGADREGAG